MDGSCLRESRGKKLLKVRYSNQLQINKLTRIFRFYHPLITSLEHRLILESWRWMQPHSHHDICGRTSYVILHSCIYAVAQSLKVSCKVLMLCAASYLLLLNEYWLLEDIFGWSSSASKVVGCCMKEWQLLKIPSEDDNSWQALSSTVFYFNCYRPTCGFCRMSSTSSTFKTNIQ